MAAYHVTIGPEFFAKSRNDYDDWRWAVVREFFQNSIDCGSEQISLDVALGSDGNTVVTVTNNGRPMTRETIVNKLFSLGSSGKNFEGGTTGGFGKAKEVLYFCHKCYEIVSGDWVVVGSGAQYDVSESASSFAGTRSTIVIEGDHADMIVSKARTFVRYAQVSPEFVINGQSCHATLRKGSPRRDLGFGKVYTNKSYSNTLIVRINGIPMFTYPVGLDKCVIVELTGNSDQVLTANRDGLVQPYKTELSDFITELSVDRRSALRKRSMVPHYIHYSGSKLCHHNRLNVAAVVTNAAKTAASSAAVQTLPDTPVVQGVDVAGNQVVQAPICSASTTDRWGGSARSVGECGAAPAVQRMVTLGTDFIMKNETEMRIPSHFDPASIYFGTYAEKLVRIWGRLVLEMHRLFDHESTFSVGFIFDDGELSCTEAEFENGDFGKVYYLNPAVVAEQKYTMSKSFKKRFKLTERDRLITIAAHEFVHGLGYGWHDERYANQLTEVMAKVMKHRRRFNWCFA